MAFGKGIPLGANFDLGTTKPLDSRIVVDTKTELQEHINMYRVYSGMIVYVKEDKKTYQYNGTEFVEFGEGVKDYNDLINKPILPRASVIVDTYEDIKRVEDVQEGLFIYVKSDKNRNDEANVYIVLTTKTNENGNVIPNIIEPLSTFAKSAVPTLSYESSMPEGTRIYKNANDDLVIRFNFNSDTYGDGNYKVYRDGILIRSFSSTKGTVVCNLGPIGTDGTYEITVTASDYLGIPAPQTLIFAVIVGGLKLTSTFDETLLNTIFGTGNEIQVPYSATVSDKTAQIKVYFKLTDGTGTVFEDTVELVGASVSTTWSSINTQQRGQYLLEIQAFTGADIK